MGSLKNVENSCQSFSEADNEDRCLIIRQLTIKIMNRSSIIGFYDFE